jgi:hypothetical protein
MSVRAIPALTHPLTRPYTISTRLRRSVTIRLLAQKSFGVENDVEKGVEGGSSRWAPWTRTKDPSGG